MTSGKCGDQASDTMPAQSPTWCQPADCASLAISHEHSQPKFTVVLYRLQCISHHRLGSDLRKGQAWLCQPNELWHRYCLAEGSWPKGMASCRGHSKSYLSLLQLGHGIQQSHTSRTQTRGPIHKKILRQT